MKPGADVMIIITPTFQWSEASIPGTYRDIANTIMALWQRVWVEGLQSTPNVSMIKRPPRFTKISLIISLVCHDQETP
jgi:hypothetical protein